MFSAGQVRFFTVKNMAVVLARWVLSLCGSRGCYKK